VWLHGATTHWRFARDVQTRFPQIEIEADLLHLSDGMFHSSGGLSAGIDLALSMVQADLGSEVAVAAARELVMYMQRPGNQRQFSAPLKAQLEGHGRLAPVLEWMLSHLHEQMTVEQMAEVANMSPRHFRRVFRERFHSNPARYLEHLRLERACVLLTSGNASIQRIASQTGFTNADTFRRRFGRCFHISPGAYRKRFGSDRMQATDTDNTVQL